MTQTEDQQIVCITGLFRITETYTTNLENIIYDWCRQKNITEITYM